MARSGVDYAQVSAAALGLVQDGEQVTVDNVRLRLGGTGSKSTIAPLLRRWKAEYVEMNASANPGLPQDLLGSVKRLYEEVRVQFQKDLDAAISKAASEVADLNSSNTALQKKNAELANKCKELLDEVTNVSAEYRSAATELAAERINLRELESENASLERLLNERGSEVANLRDQVIQGRRQFDHFQAATQSRWDDERRNSEARLADALRESKRLQQAVQFAQNEVLAQNMRLEQATCTLEQRTNECRQLTDDLDELRQESHRKDARLEKNNAQLADSKKALAKLQAEHDAIKFELSETKTARAIAQSKADMFAAARADLERKMDDALKEQIMQVRRCAEVENELRQCQDALHRISNQDRS